MKALALMAAFTVVGSPIAATVIAVARAPLATIDRAITVLVFGIVLVMLGVTAWLVLAGAARLRQAKHAEPSHNIAVDRRTQNVDARRVMMLVTADGKRLELPAGARLVEVVQ